MDPSTKTEDRMYEHGSAHRIEVRLRPNRFWLHASGSFAVVTAAFAMACTHTDAANVGAAVGHGLGTPLGAATVAIEETFATAGDVQAANPRHQSRDRGTRPVPPRAAHRIENGSASKSQEPRAVGDHYYRADVLVRTRGPAEIESIDVGETRDVTEFWQ